MPLAGFDGGGDLPHRTEHGVESLGGKLARTAACPPPDETALAKAVSAMRP